MCSTFLKAGGTAGMMTDGMARVGIGAGIACVKAWDGAVNAVGIVGNITSVERNVVNTDASKY
jgi:hypothetical protein